MDTDTVKTAVVSDSGRADEGLGPFIDVNTSTLGDKYKHQDYLVAKYSIHKLSMRECTHCMTTTGYRYMTYTSYNDGLLHHTKV